MVSEKLNVRQININKKYYVDLYVYCTMSPGACKLNGVSKATHNSLSKNHKQSAMIIELFCVAMFNSSDGILHWKQLTQSIPAECLNDVNVCSKKNT